MIAAACYIGREEMFLCHESRRVVMEHESPTVSQGVELASFEKLACLPIQLQVALPRDRLTAGGCRAMRALCPLLGCYREPTVLDDLFDRGVLAAAVPR